MEKRIPQNRFEKLSKLSKTIFFILFFVIMLVTLELGTLATTFLLNKTFGIGKGAFKQYSENFHPLFSGKPLKPLRTGTDPLWHYWNEYDPWYGYRNSYKLKSGIYGTDMMGFISDGDPSRDISSKQNNVFRVFILGGSTVAGHGSSSPNKTISRQLQDYLNSHKPTDIRYTFQVINAGVAGYYSPIELAYLEFEILYYQPDMIIVFDGYNDFKQLFPKSKENKPNIERYHWSTYHHDLKSYIDNSNSRFIFPKHFQPQRYFYFADFLVRLFNYRQDGSPKLELPKVVKENYPNIAKADFYPVNRFMEGLEFKNWLTLEEINDLESDINYDTIRNYVNNVIFMKAVCTTKNIHFLSVLQPMLIPQFKRHLTDKEEFHFNSKLQHIAQLHDVNYQQMLYEFSKLSSKILTKQLNNDLFLDLTTLFNDIEDNTYFDWAHYNDVGNSIISKRLAAIVFSKKKR